MPKQHNESEQRSSNIYLTNIPSKLGSLSNLDTTLYGVGLNAELIMGSQERALEKHYGLQQEELGFIVANRMFSVEDLDDAIKHGREEGGGSVAVSNPDIPPTNDPDHGIIENIGS
jgi:hypothetical protein